MIETAERLARMVHAGQMYGGNEYTKHLADVVSVLVRFGYDRPELIAAAWLHDSVEDTPVTFEQLETVVSPEVYAIVKAVTNRPGNNRRERHAATYPEIRKAGTDAVVVKLADRIANMEASLRENPGLLKMYRKEHPAFREALYVVGEADAMWERLEELQ